MRVGQRRRLCGLEHAGDCSRVALPGGELGAELGASPRGQLIELGLAVVLRDAPLALDPARALEAVERRVERAFLDEKDIVAAFTDLSGDGVSVQWSPAEGLEDEEVECSLQEVERGHGGCSPYDA